MSHLTFDTYEEAEARSIRAWHDLYAANGGGEPFPVWSITPTGDGKWQVEVTSRLGLSEEEFREVEGEG